jgi:hypothetical protein
MSALPGAYGFGSYGHVLPLILAQFFKYRDSRRPLAVSKTLEYRPGVRSAPEAKNRFSSDDRALAAPRGPLVNFWGLTLLVGSARLAPDLSRLAYWAGRRPGTRTVHCRRSARRTLSQAVRACRPKPMVRRKVLLRPIDGLWIGGVYRPRRTSRPGLAPVCAPRSNTGMPATRVAS